MKPTLEQVKAFIETDLDVAKPPSPYDIALALSAALLASGRFAEDPAAAVATGWTLVLPFYQGQGSYVAHGQALFDMAKHASAAEPDMTSQEGRAYVTGGETGDTGEAGGRLRGSATIQLAPAPAAATAEAQAWQQHIADANLATREAWEAWQDAKAAFEAEAASDDLAAAVIAAKANFERAARVQSAAHLPEAARGPWVDWQEAQEAHDDDAAAGHKAAFEAVMAAHQ